MPKRNCRVCQKVMDAVTNQRYHKNCRSVYLDHYNKLYQTHYNRYGPLTESQLKAVKERARKLAANELGVL